LIGSDGGDTGMDAISNPTGEGARADHARRLCELPADGPIRWIRGRCLRNGRRHVRVDEGGDPPVGDRGEASAAGRTGQPRVSAPGDRHSSRDLPRSRRSEFVPRGGPRADRDRTSRIPARGWSRSSARARTPGQHQNAADIPRLGKRLYACEKTGIGSDDRHGDRRGPQVRRIVNKDLRRQSDGGGRRPRMLASARGRRGRPPSCGHEGGRGRRPCARLGVLHGTGGGEVGGEGVAGVGAGRAAQGGGLGSAPPPTPRGRGANAARGVRAPPNRNKNALAGTFVAPLPLPGEARNPNGP